MSTEVTSMLEDVTRALENLTYDEVQELTTLPTKAELIAMAIEEHGVEKLFADLCEGESDGL